MLGMLARKEPSPHGCLFWEMEEQTAVRRGNYKLVLNGRLEEDQPPRAPVFLADLSVDPGEKHNLADAMPELRDEQTRLALNWRDGIEETWNRDFARNYTTTA